MASPPPRLRWPSSLRSHRRIFEWAPKRDLGNVGISRAHMKNYIGFMFEYLFASISRFQYLPLTVPTRFQKSE